MTQDDTLFLAKFCGTLAIVIGGFYLFYRVVWRITEGGKLFSLPPTKERRSISLFFSLLFGIMSIGLTANVIQKREFVKVDLLPPDLQCVPPLGFGIFAVLFLLYTFGYTRPWVTAYEDDLIAGEAKLTDLSSAGGILDFFLRLNNTGYGFWIVVIVVIILITIGASLLQPTEEISGTDIPMYSLTIAAIETNAPSAKMTHFTSFNRQPTQVRLPEILRTPARSN